VAYIRKYPRIAKKVLVFCSFLLVLGGCKSSEVRMPEIVYNPSTGFQSPPPLITEPQTNNETSYSNVPSAWLPPASVEKKWTAIIIHHSATEKGNATIFNKWHIEQNGWDGVGYDFVIGNGTDSGDGQIEVTFRWRKQIPGAHCGGTEGNWANEDGIGICLVGDFNNKNPSDRQIQSLVRLVRFLKNRYAIPISRIYGHGTTPGAHITDCPGTMFPMARFKSMLDY
jgi:hypothetical protein